MREHFTLPDWSSLAVADDDRLPLLATALLIARDEYPELDADLYDTLLQSHAEHLRPQVEASDEWPLKMAAINQHLFEELGYKGDRDEYYDPRNSYLNEVFERRLGNPISLALVQIEVARRLGVPLDEEELRRRARPHLGGEAPDDHALGQILHPATHRAILMRMLRNLHGVYTDRDDWERAARCADRILRLAPDSSDALRDRGLAYLKMGHRHGARTDLARYLQLNPEAPDSGPLRERVVELSSAASRPN